MKKIITKLIYWILIINIPLSIASSFLIIALEGNSKGLNLVWNFTPDYFFAVFLGFLIAYPFSFFFLYTVSFVLIKLVKMFIKS